jgi:hypothetical protein
LVISKLNGGAGPEVFQGWLEGTGMHGVRRLAPAVAATVQPTAIACSAEKLERNEAGSDCCYIKFGGARSGAALELLFDACETLASAKRLSRLIAGANAGRERAYRRMIAHGFRSDFQGVAMQKHNDAGYNRPSTYIVDDWR